MGQHSLAQSPAPTLFLHRCGLSVQGFSVFQQDMLYVRLGNYLSFQLRLSHFSLPASSSSLCHAIDEFSQKISRRTLLSQAVKRACDDVYVN